MYAFPLTYMSYDSSLYLRCDETCKSRDRGLENFFLFYSQTVVYDSSVFFLFISDPPLSCLSEYATVGPHSDSGNSTGTGNPSVIFVLGIEYNIY